MNFRKKHSSSWNIKHDTNLLHQKFTQSIILMGSCGPTSQQMDSHRQSWAKHVWLKRMGNEKWQRTLVSPLPFRVFVVSGSNFVLANTLCRCKPFNGKPTDTVMDLASSLFCKYVSVFAKGRKNNGYLALRGGIFKWPSGSDTPSNPHAIFFPSQLQVSILWYHTSKNFAPLTSSKGKKQAFHLTPEFSMPLQTQPGRESSRIADWWHTSWWKAWDNSRLLKNSTRLYTIAGLHSFFSNYVYMFQQAECFKSKFTVLKSLEISNSSWFHWEFRGSTAVIDILVVIAKFQPALISTNPAGSTKSSAISSICKLVEI